MQSSNSAELAVRELEFSNETIKETSMTAIAPESANNPVLLSPPKVDTPATSISSRQNSETITDDDSCNLLNCACLEKVSDIVIRFIESIFYKIGYFVGRYPWAGMLIGLLIFLLPLLGVMNFYEETDGSKLWVPQNSRAVADKKTSEDWFPGQLRVAQVVLVADDVLTPDVLEKALQLDEQIKNITIEHEGQVWDFEDICYRTGPYCLQSSLLELWSWNRTAIEALSKSDIVNEINTASASPVTNSPIKVDLLIGGSEDSDSDGNIDKAKAMAMTYQLQTYRATNDPESYLLDWEKNHLELCEQFSENGIKVYYFASRSFGDIGGGAIDDDLQFLAGGYFLVVLYLIMALGKFNCLEQKVYVAIAGILCIAMSLGISYGLSSALGLDFGPLHNVLPFLLLGVGVDDMFVFVAAWDNLERHEISLPLSQKIALMTKHAGVSILITSLTDFAAFAIGATTIIPALRSFCLFAAMGILGIFLVTLFLFAGFFAYDQKRTAARRNACLPCLKFSDRYKPNKCSQSPLSVRVFDRVIAKILSFTAVKVCVVLMSVILFAFGIWGTVEIEQDYQEDWFIPSGNYLKDYIKVTDEYFSEDGYNGYVYFGNIDYYSGADLLLALPDQLGEVKGVSGSSIDFWMEAFYQWTASTANATYTAYITAGEPMDKDSFDYLAYEFITHTSQGSKYQSDVQFETASPHEVLRSRMSVTFAKTDFSADGISAMENSREVLDSLGYDKDIVFIYTRLMLSWEGDKVIREELFRNIGLAFIVVLLVCMLLIANVVTVLLVFACVVFTLVDVIGFLHWWGNTINTVTTIMTILAVGLAVDYAAHIGHVFMVCTGSRQVRMRTSLREMGTAVFNGGFSTFLAFLPLALSVSFVFQKFFQIFFLVSMFGLFHGLIFLPVMLSWIGPSPYKSAYQKNQTESTSKHEDVESETQMGIQNLTYAEDKQKK